MGSVLAAMSRQLNRFIGISAFRLHFFYIIFYILFRYLNTFNKKNENSCYGLYNLDMYMDRRSAAIGCWFLFDISLNYFELISLSKYKKKNIIRSKCFSRKLNIRCQENRHYKAFVTASTYALC